MWGRLEETRVHEKEIICKDYRAIRQSDNQTIRQSDNQTILFVLKNNIPKFAFYRKQ